MWVIESGKHEAKPHLHIHFICQIRKDRSKKHKANIIERGIHIFPITNLLGMITILYTAILNKLSKTNLIIRVMT
jgi:hypothetical protein